MSILVVYSGFSHEAGEFWLGHSTWALGWHVHTYGQRHTLHGQGGFGFGISRGLLSLEGSISVYFVHR
jgi:hypothetical protein